MPPARSIASARPSSPDVVDDLLARRVGKDSLGHQRCREVTGDELPGVVDEEAPVRVAVVRDAEIGGLLRHLRDDELAVLGKERVGLVIRKGPVRVEVAAHDLELGKVLENGRKHHACHPVRRVDDDAQRLDRATSTKESTFAT